jgi:hypothetical protein
VAESAKRLAQVHGVDFGRMQVKQCSLRRVFLLFLNRCLQVALQFNALLRKHSKKAALVVTNLPLVCNNLYSRCIYRPKYIVRRYVGHDRKILWLILARWRQILNL